MKYCVHCGKEIPSDSTFCSACGKIQKATETNAPPYQYHQKKQTSDAPTKKGIFSNIQNQLNISNIVLAVGIIFVIILSLDWLFTFEMGHAIARGNKSEINSVASGYDTIQKWLKFQLIYISLFLFWVYKSYKQLPAINEGKARWSPGWAICSWFVPILNLWRPYQVMTELWNKSNPTNASTQSGLFSSSNKTLYWWFISITSAFYGKVSSQKLSDTLSSKSSILTLKNAFMQDCWSIAYLISSVIFTMYLVKKISYWQRRPAYSLDSENNITAITKEGCELNKN